MILMLRWKYADAYPLWADLAADSTYADSIREDFMRKAAESALHADLLAEAADWNGQDDRNRSRSARGLVDANGLALLPESV